MTTDRQPAKDFGASTYFSHKLKPTKEIMRPSTAFMSMGRDESHIENELRGLSLFKNDNARIGGDLIPEMAFRTKTLKSRGHKTPFDEDPGRIQQLEKVKSSLATKLISFSRKSTNLGPPSESRK